jgi:hypothetical protein
MATLSNQDRSECLEHTQKAIRVLRKYDKHMEPYDEIDNLDHLDHHLRLVEALLENN